MRRLFAAGAVVTSMALTACGPSGGEPVKVADAKALGADAVAPAAASPPPAGLTLVIQDHRFIPDEITVPANTKVEIEVINKDPLAEEFESHDLRIEKVIGGKSSGTIRLKPLDPGRYSFTGEYHAETAKGVVIAK